MKRIMKVYLVISLGIFLGFSILIWVNLYRIWIFGDFFYYEDNFPLLLIETILSIMIIPSLFILLWVIVANDR